ncbi:P2X purinoceptor 7 [Holothuria leucospilota]|uniref:P2X purinoceptor 7 n=1 Tax=Holothuria leucospilota TaxID=206669 RepID=A0A9Q1GWB4_HOLLE|nr:P2X purinoceptor 7 [Holothuria leucospilota]
MTDQQPAELYEEQSDDDSSSGSEIGLELECTFSDFEVENEGSDSDRAGSEPDSEPEVLGIEPYQFEPVRREDVIPQQNEPQQENREDRMQGTETWCTCGHCIVMPSERECLCCHEVSKIDQKRRKGKVQPICITQKPGFQSVCLDHDVLETAFYQFNQEYEDDIGEDLIHEQYRYIAYRQLVRWCWGFLGRHVRVILPSCAVQRIRAEFPADGEYTGFKLPGED